MLFLKYIKKDRYNDIDFITSLFAMYCLAANENWFGAAAWFAVSLVANVALSIAGYERRASPNVNGDEA